MLEISLLVLIVALLLGTLAPYTDRKEWWVRGWEFARLQLAALSLILAGVAYTVFAPAGVLEWVVVLLPLACLPGHIVPILPFMPFRRPEVPPADPEDDAGERLSLIVSNVQMQNRSTDLLVDLVKERKPDLLLAVETDTFWGERLRSLGDLLPHKVECPLDNTYGMHLYSRFPLEQTEVRHLIQEDVPSIETLVVLPEGQQVRLYCVHPAPPSPSENWESAERDAELIQIGRMAAASDLPVIVAGDLNDVAWSRMTKYFREISGLLDPRVGRGLFNTFHAGIPLLRWPLDHIFHSADFRLVRLERLPAIKSDHFPVFGEWILPHRGRD